MFLMPAGAGGYLNSMWRKLFRARPRQGGAVEQSVVTEAVSFEPAIELPVVTPATAVGERTVVRRASEDAVRDDR
jgi:hypothetical protein